MSLRIPIRLLAAQSDERLVALVREGHERAFEAVVHRYRPPLLRYCRRLRLSEQRAEDVLQHAFLQAWMGLSEGPEVRDLKPWLYRIVHNTAVNSMRGASLADGALANIVHARSVFGAESDLEVRLAARQALSEVAALPDMQRQVISLTALGGHSHEEVASTLGISDGAVRGLLYRARCTLRSAAVALTPQWLINWACTGAGAPAGERISEVAAGGAVSMTGILTKSAVVAVTAGVIAAGAGVAHHHRLTAKSSRGQTSLQAAMIPDSPQTAGERTAPSRLDLSDGNLRVSAGRPAHHGSNDRGGPAAPKSSKGRALQVNQDKGNRGSGITSPSNPPAGNGDLSSGTVDHSHRDGGFGGFSRGPNAGETNDAAESPSGSENGSPGGLTVSGARGPVDAQDAGNGTDSSSSGPGSESSGSQDTNGPSSNSVDQQGLQSQTNTTDSSMQAAEQHQSGGEQESAGSESTERDDQTTRHGG
jgi:RNA polymerase sigma factor (sigma-70 family)